jgi:peptide-methionine (S)-S-oxide reductase
MKQLLFVLAGLIIITSTVFLFGGMKNKDTMMPPSPMEKEAGQGDMEIAVLAGGCFWGIEGIYERLRGVDEAIPGYAGGAQESAMYDMVSSGKTGHAESVYILYDPKIISFKTLLEVFFTIAHNPTQLDYQGPDKGSQYRSAIFYVNMEQQKIAREYIEVLNKEKMFDTDIVTQVVPLDEFYPAEEYHQDFMERNPDHAYIVYWDIPKVDHLYEAFPGLIKEEYKREKM